MNQIESMRIFATVAQCLNFGDAARQLGLSNSAVTRAVLNLEAHLNLRLINRTTRHVSLTPVGESYLEGCSDVLLQLQRIEDKVRSESRLPSGRLKLAVPALFATTFLPPLLADFGLSNPLVSFDLIVFDNAGEVSSADFEVCIMVERKLRDSSLVCRAIGRSTDVIVAAPSYLQRRGVPVSPNNLTDHQILLDSAESTMRCWTFTDAAGDNRVPFMPFLTAQTAVIVEQCAIAGLGIARLPSLMVDEHVRAGRLVRLLQDFAIVGGDRTVWILYSGQRHATETARAFVEFAAQWNPGIQRSA